MMSDQDTTLDELDDVKGHRRLGAAVAAALFAGMALVPASAHVDGWSPTSTDTVTDARKCKACWD